MLDHVHMLISIPPKHSVSSVLGFLKGKSLIWIAQNVANKQRNFVGHKFWARGYFFRQWARMKVPFAPISKIRNWTTNYSIA